MAGSWRHMTTRGGKLLSNERFAGSVENLGDAYETAEECFGMVWWLAERVASVIGGQSATREDAKRLVELAEAHYRDGLKLGGVQRPR